MFLGRIVNLYLLHDTIWTWTAFCHDVKFLATLNEARVLKQSTKMGTNCIYPYLCPNISASLFLNGWKENWMDQFHTTTVAFVVLLLLQFHSNMILNTWWSQNKKFHIFLILILVPVYQCCSSSLYGGGVWSNDPKGPINRWTCVHGFSLPVVLN